MLRKGCWTVPGCTLACTGGGSQDAWVRILVGRKTSCPCIKLATTSIPSGEHHLAASLGTEPSLPAPTGPGITKDGRPASPVILIVRRSPLSRCNLRRYIKAILIAAVTRESHGLISMHTPHSSGSPIFPACDQPHSPRLMPVLVGSLSSGAAPLLVQMDASGNSTATTNSLHLGLDLEKKTANRCSVRKNTSPIAGRSEAWEARWRRLAILVSLDKRINVARTHRSRWSDPNARSERHVS